MSDKLYLNDEKFIDFIKTRQPDVSAVPENAINDIAAYFRNGIDGFTLLKVCRHSNHPEDNYLYSVIARKDIDGSYACWSIFNDSTKSMNGGHYNLASEEDALSIIRDHFFDITDDMKHFGPEVSMTKIPQEQFVNEVCQQGSGEVIPFRHRIR